MKFNFCVSNYKTNYGESLYIILQPNSDDTRIVEMTYENNCWTYGVNFSSSGECSKYQYAVYPSNFTSKDFAEMDSKDKMCDKHHIDALIRDIPKFDEKTSSECCISINDDWAPNPYEPWNTSAYRVFFDKGLPTEETSIPYFRKTDASFNISFRVMVPVKNDTDSVYVVGSHPSLGKWDASRALLLTPVGNRNFVASMKISSEDTKRIEYKFVIAKKDGKGSIVWEDGKNRVITLKQGVANVEQSFFKFNASIPDHRNYVLPRFTGINVPVFSLRSAKSFGCGEFADLKVFADFCKSAGVNIIQILPIFDTMSRGTWVDSYPYGAITVFALHPMFVRLADIAGVSNELSDEIEKARMRYNEDEVIEDKNADIEMDYEKTVTTKIDFLHRIFDQLTSNLETTKVLYEELNNWIKSNPEVGYWVRGYSVFKALGEYYGNVEFNPSSHYTAEKAWKGSVDFSNPFDTTKRAVYSHEDFMMLPDNASKQQEIAEIYSVSDKRVVFWTWVQYILDQQVRDAANYARKRNICLKGDVPIGVNRISVDTWERTTLFNMDTMTGAPPDAFSAVGQNWGFPTYNWDAMKLDGDYEWWTMRFRTMARYFDAFRIDHVLGWFRIWEIPAYSMKGNGRLGHFSPCKAIYKDWLAEKGVWDFDMLCDAYMPEKHVEEYCGYDAEYYRFLTEGVGNLKPVLVKKDANTYMFNPEVVEPDNIETSIHDYFMEFIDTDCGVSGVTNTASASASFLEAEEDMDSNVFILRQNFLEKAFLICQLLNCNRCLTRDRKYPTTFFHPVFANLEDKTQTLAFRDLDQGWRNTIRQFTHDYFFKWHGEEWTATAAERMPIISNAADMLVIGEDLGLLHPCVPVMMDKRKMLGLRVQRMPADPTRDFTDIHNYEWMTVATPSTHDCPGIKSWWAKGGETIQKFWNYELRRGYSAPKSISPEDCRNIVRMHTYSDSMISMFLLQDLFCINKSVDYKGDVEREDINHPDVPEWYWRYRMHIPIEELTEKYNFDKDLKLEFMNAGRYVGNNL